MKTLILLGLAATAVYATDARANGVPSGDSTEAAGSVLHQAGTSYTPPAYTNGGDYEFHEDEVRTVERAAPAYEQRSYRRSDYDASRSYRYDDRYSDAEMARMCRNDNGLGGAAIGGVVGGIAGNRIAGRGDRTIGTVVGAVAGAAVGGTIDRNADKRRCEDYQRRVAYEREYRDYYDRYYGQSGGRYDASHHGYHGSEYGYNGYYTVPETHVTTEYVPYETVTTTTETEWEYVYPRTKKVLSKKRVRKPVLIMK